MLCVSTWKQLSVQLNFALIGSQSLFLDRASHIKRTNELQEGEICTVSSFTS